MNSCELRVPTCECVTEMSRTENDTDRKGRETGESSEPGRARLQAVPIGGKRDAGLQPLRAYFP